MGESPTTLNENSHHLRSKGISYFSCKKLGQSHTFWQFGIEWGGFLDFLKIGIALDVLLEIRLIISIYREIIPVHIMDEVYPTSRTGIPSPVFR